MPTSASRRDSPYSQSIGGGSIHSNGTRFSMKEFKAATGGTPGSAPPQGIAETAQTPRGFDVSAVSGNSEGSKHSVASSSPESVLASQLLKSENWQYVLKEAMIEETVGVKGANEYDQEMIERIHGVKNKAEGRAVSLTELLGYVHESKLKTNPSVSARHQEVRPTVFSPPAPPQHMVGSDNVVQHKRVSYTNANGERRREDVPTPLPNLPSNMTSTAKKAPYSAGGGGMGDSRDEISALSSPTMSLGGQPSFSPSMATPKSPPRDVPLHKAHTLSSGVKANNVPISTIAASPAATSRGGINEGSHNKSGHYASAQHSMASQRIREDEQERKVRLLFTKMDQMETQIHRLEKAVLIALDHGHLTRPMTVEGMVWVIKNFITVTIPRAIAAFFLAIVFFMKVVAVKLLKVAVQTASFGAAYVLMFHLAKLLIVLMSSFLPPGVMNPILGSTEAILGASWGDSDVYTLPGRLLRLYQTLLHPHVGYLGVCTAQSHGLDLLKYVGWVDYTNFEGCLLPEPHDVVAIAAKNGWF